MDTEPPTSSVAIGPRVGVGAAILDDEGRLLLVKRRRAPEAGCWGLPGGKVEFLEPLETAVVREIEEELGIRITLQGLVCLTDQIDEAHSTHWVAPVYLAHIKDGAPVNREPDALAAIGWFPLEELPDRLTIATRQALPWLLRK
ncbi:MAG TPA: NUDIX domain-containing protein [Azospirillaceae bacterium]|nr:NUDIX domain-containing protein [Azospirillaceae bacterium]